MINKKTLVKIKKLAIKIDWHDSFNGKSKGNRHLLRVVEIAKFIAKKMDADINIVEAGALLHDLALPTGDDYNYEKNKCLAVKKLQQFNLKKFEKENIAECVASHEGIIKPKTLEAKIVHDADVLEKSGILGIIRQTWKLTHLNKLKSVAITNSEINNILAHLNWRKSRLQTEVAKKLHQSITPALNKKQIKKIIQTTALMAENGAITEQIAKNIDKYLNARQKTKLKAQLNLSYLKK